MTKSAQFRSQNVPKVGTVRFLVHFGTEIVHFLPLARRHVCINGP